MRREEEIDLVGKANAGDPGGSGCRSAACWVAIPILGKPTTS